MPSRAGHQTWGIAAIAVAATAVYWRTAYPTITWWDSSHYSLAAGTLGVTSPPGSLLLTLLGWPLINAPTGLSPAHTVNLFAGLLAVVAVGCVYLTGTHLLRLTQRTGPGIVAGCALGALTFAFSATLWDYAIRFTPYVLTVVFTGLILLAMLRWWERADEPGEWKLLALVALLVGLDFSVHRTNSLLLPGLAVWVLMRRPRALLSVRVWAGAVVAMTAGLSLHLLIIPIANATTSPLNSFAPTTLSLFWDYVSLANSGGNFLVDLWPRKADLLPVQVADFLRTLRDAFLPLAPTLGPLRFAPALAVLGGVVVLWRADRRLTTALLALIVIHAAGTIAYFNIPADYFRSLDRHYLPVHVTVATFAVVGLGALSHAAATLAHGGRRTAAAIVVVVTALAPAVQLAANWSARDASDRYFARDFAANVLQSLPQNAIHVTYGDNDYFPLQYLQSVEGVRPDVRILNTSMLQADWYVEHLRRIDPGLPFSMTSDERQAAVGPWTGDEIVIPVLGAGDAVGIAAPSAIPDSVRMRPAPMWGTVALHGDVALLDIVRTNAWRRPLTFSALGGDGALGWLTPFARLDGMFWRIVPAVDPLAEPEALRTNLLERHVYRGYAEPREQADNVTRAIGVQYLRSFGALAEAERALGLTDRCRAAQRAAATAIPLETLGVSREQMPQLSCG